MVAGPGGARQCRTQAISGAFPLPPRSPDADGTLSPSPLVVSTPACPGRTSPSSRPGSAATCRPSDGTGEALEPLLVGTQRFRPGLLLRCVARRTHLQEGRFASASDKRLARVAQRLGPDAGEADQSGVLGDGEIHGAVSIAFEADRAAPQAEVSRGHVFLEGGAGRPERVNPGRPHALPGVSARGSSSRGASSGAANARSEHPSCLVRVAPAFMRTSVIRFWRVPSCQRSS